MSYDPQTERELTRRVDTFNIRNGAHQAALAIHGKGHPEEVRTRGLALIAAAQLRRYREQMEQDQ